MGKKSKRQAKASSSPSPSPPSSPTVSMSAKSISGGASASASSASASMSGSSSKKTTTVVMQKKVLEAEYLTEDQARAARLLVSRNLGSFLALGHKRPSSSQESESFHEDSTSDGENEFRLEALEKHNEIRLSHGVRPLRLSQLLCNQAQDWAETLAKKDKLAYKKDKHFGENVFCIATKDKKVKVTGATPVESWYSEEKKYNYGKDGSDATRSFTQMVWQSTTEMGIGFSMAPKSGNLYIVANYGPVGNVNGAYQNNVFKHRDAEAFAKQAAERLYWARHLQIAVAGMSMSSSMSTTETVIISGSASASMVTSEG